MQTHSNSDLKFTTNDGNAQMTLQKGTGNFGIGTVTPSEKLEVSGKTKTADLQVTTGASAGKVLTSDASGNATWQDATTFALPYTGSLYTSNPVFSVTNLGNGNGIEGIANSTNGAGIIGKNSVGGDAIYGNSTGGSASGSSAVAGLRSSGSGYGVQGRIDGSTGTGVAVYGKVSNSGSTGNAGRFENANASNTQDVLMVLSESTSNLAVFRKSGTNVSRIDQTGKGFFNGGTQNSGADLAEAFDVEGDKEHYEPGDILVISTKTDRSVEKSSQAYSNLVAGVYATKPGVLLTEENIDSNLEGKIPMGVIGVIPTKVNLEGGQIKRGDLLVTSSVSGVAMKADPNKVKVGEVLGKALQEYKGLGTGKINVLVSIK